MTVSMSLDMETDMQHYSKQEQSSDITRNAAMCPTVRVIVG